MKLRLIVLAGLAGFFWISGANIRPYAEPSGISRRGDCRGDLLQAEEHHGPAEIDRKLERE